MINAKEAKRQTDDNVVLEPISNFNKICEILESFRYVCRPRSLTDIVEGCVLPERISKKAYVTISWKGANIR